MKRPGAALKLTSSSTAANALQNLLTPSSSIALIGRPDGNYRQPARYMVLAYCMSTSTK